MRFVLQRIRDLGLLSFLIPLPLAAHHSTSEYDVDPVITTVEGVLSEIRWANPHIQFHVMETNDEGSSEEWILEQPSAIAMNNFGISRDLFEVGAPVRVNGPISQRREGRMVGWNMLLLRTGVEVILVPARSAGPLWSERVVGSSADDLFSVSGPVPNRRESLFRVWSWEPVPEFWMMRDPDYFPLNDRAREAWAEWDVDDLSDNTVLRCVPPGMPATMGDPHPIRFVDLGDVIEIRMEEFDQVRRIHMDGQQDPELISTSPLGFSIGRWEDQSLVIETTRVDAGYLTRHGIPMSPEARLEERFILDAADGRLRYVLTVEDPEYLTEPFAQELVWIWHEGTSLQTYDCQIPE
jgi:hypothetical protein